MIKFSEVYEKGVRVTKQRSDGSEYTNFDKVLDARECLINEDYIVSIRPYEFTASSTLKNIEARFPEGTKFSLIVVDGNSFRTSELIVVGSFTKFCRLLQENKS